MHDEKLGVSYEINGPLPKIGKNKRGKSSANRTHVRKTASIGRHSRRSSQQKPIIRSILGKIVL